MVQFKHWKKPHDVFIQEAQVDKNLETFKHTNAGYWIFIQSNVPFIQDSNSILLSMFVCINTNK